jgi:hypothetical protein
MVTLQKISMKVMFILISLVLKVHKTSCYERANILKYFREK